MKKNISVLMITSEFPTSDHPDAVPFIAREVELLRLRGVSVDVYAFRGRRKLVNYLSGWRDVQQIIKNSNYDLVHAQFGQSAMLALFPKKKPLIITFRGSDVEGIVDSNYRYTFQGKILQWISWYVAKRADACILVSNTLRKKLPEKEYFVIPSGINLDRFKPEDKSKARIKLGLSLTSKYVLFAGNPDQSVKRFHLAQDVIRIVQEIIPEVVLISPRGLDHQEMPVYLNASDALLMTSIHEGSPNMVKEALACNLPVVSTNVGDVKERLNGIEGCFVCDSNSAELLADSLIEVLSEPKKINGRESVQDLSEELGINKLISVYEQTLKMRNTL